MAPAMVTGDKLTTNKNSKTKPVDPKMKPGQKRSAAEAGLSKQDSGPGGKKFGRNFHKTPGKKPGVWPVMGHGRGRRMVHGQGHRTGQGMGSADRAARPHTDSNSSIPRFFQRVAALKAIRHSLAGKTIDVGNLPDMEEKKLSKKLLGLLSRHGKIVTHEFYTNSKSKVFRVVFETYDAALAAKKLNGEVLKDKHLCILHRQDSYIHLPNRIMVNNIKEVVTNADYDFIWKTFGGCGKIYSIMMCFKKADKCLLTFETMKGKSKALSLSEKFKENNIHVSDIPLNAMEFRRIYLGNLSEDVSQKDIEMFVANVGQHSEVNRVASGTAYVDFKEKSDIVKALPLDGKMLKGKKVFVYVAEFTYSLFNESEICRQEMEEEGGDSDDEEEVADDSDDEEEVEDDDEEEEEDDDDEEEEDDNDDDDEEEEEEDATDDDVVNE